MIYNTTTDQLEVGDDAENWSALGGGSDNSLSEADQSIGSNDRIIDLGVTGSLSVTQGQNTFMEIQGNGTVNIALASDPYDSNWGSDLNAAPKQDVYNEMETRVKSDATGEPTGFGTVNNLGTISETALEAAILAATTVAGTYYIVTGVKPAKVVSADPINLNRLMTHYDDTTTDDATITFQNLEDGAKFKIFINRAAAPTFAGATMNQLPNTTAFAAATDMVISGEVVTVGATQVIDYFYYER
jgi:hypothetical protein